MSARVRHWLGCVAGMVAFGVFFALCGTVPELLAR